MKDRTTISPDLIQAYRETQYRVEGGSPFTLMVGQVSEVVLKVFSERGLKSCAFVTAWNPYSIALRPEENAIRERKLRLHLNAQGLEHTPGEGVHPSNGWAGERSSLIWGVSETSAREIAEAFQQNGFIWVGEGGVPELILLR
jgi:hypothetical protein